VALVEIKGAKEAGGGCGRVIEAKRS
jgi:hypothetical protein